MVMKKLIPLLIKLDLGISIMLNESYQNTGKIAKQLFWQLLASNSQPLKSDLITDLVSLLFCDARLALRLLTLSLPQALRLAQSLIPRQQLIPIRHLRHIIRLQQTDTQTRYCSSVH